MHRHSQSEVNGGATITGGWLAAVQAEAPCGTLFAESLKFRLRHPPVRRCLVSLPRFPGTEKLNACRFLKICDAIGARVPDVLISLLYDAVGFHLGVDPHDPDRGAVTKLYLEFEGDLPSEPGLMYLAAKASPSGTGIERYDSFDCRDRSDWMVATRPLASQPLLYAASLELLDHLEGAFGLDVFNSDIVPILRVREIGTCRYSIDINLSNIETDIDIRRIIAPFSGLFDLRCINSVGRNAISHLAVGLTHGRDAFLTLYGYPQADLGRWR